MAAILKHTYPLQWPANCPRTAKWEKSVNRSFNMGMTVMDAVNFLQEEINALPIVQEAILLTDHNEIMNPRRVAHAVHDNGVALRLRIDNTTYQLACDRWVMVEQNIYALHLVLRTLRNMTDWGVGNFTLFLAGFSGGSAGFTQTMSNGASSEEWRLYLGLGPTAKLDDAQAIYRRRAKALVNDEEEMLRLNLAMDAAEKALGL